MLEVQHVHAGYGSLQVLRDVSLRVETGELVGIIGSNGAGKSTLLRAVCGLLRPWSPAGQHRIALDGERIDGLPPHAIAQRGVAVVPEGARVFPHMTVRDNLLVGSYRPQARRRRAASFERVYNLFPRLKERAGQAAGTLSGGERQMLAIGRALMSVPRLLLLDEPSLGIAPRLVAEIAGAIRAINREGVTVVLVEQNVPVCLGVCTRAYVLEGGRVVREGSGPALLADDEVRRAYLGL